MRLPQTEGSVLLEWIDNNDHMNLAYYVLLFDLATDTIYDALGIGQAYRAATGNSTFTAEAHTIYERELLVGERVRITSHLLGADAALFPRDVPCRAGASRCGAGAAGAAY